MLQFNEIVEKNKVNLPEMNISEMVDEQVKSFGSVAKKSSLDEYLRRQQKATSKEEVKSAEHFKIDLAGDGTSSDHTNGENEGEDFSDSEEFKDTSS